jgi:hypothetical protein
MPRLTWMRDRRRLLAANRLLEQIHGGAMLLDAWYRDQLWRASTEFMDPGPLRDSIKTAPSLFQADVGLTLAGGRLMSLFSGVGICRRAVIRPISCTVSPSISTPQP